ncbi:glycosyltransferase family 1 protein [Tannockella kyphosi]|uniref:glycosyltransferase family 1 protein n=1 Tax=Tannockella kyphosi TaxID=2899121 RepID=UPI00201136A4|nr:glycosyltransferase family 1 protein [Tannockella kyphosi]
MKRVLCIVGGMNAGGAETFLMKIYRELDKSKYQMDFCVTTKKKGFYDDEICSMGGRVIRVVPKSENPIKSFFSYYCTIKNNNYKIVLRTSQHSLSAIELLIGWLAGAKTRVYRSSNSQTMGTGIEAVFHKMFSFLPKIFANVKIAPSDKAAIFMFGKQEYQNGKVLILKNGIPIDDFLFNEDLRKKTRCDLKIDDKFVMGHIGRFSNQKNHRFLIDIFSEFNKIKTNSCLLLIGTGELKDDIVSYIENKGLSNKVFLLGVRNDIPALLSAMDTFVFPSFYEGMPNTVIEAQANGLSSFISNTISNDVKINDNVHLLDIETPADKWANVIVDKYDRLSIDECQFNLTASGYNIKDVVKMFEKEVLLKEVN